MNSSDVFMIESVLGKIPPHFRLRPILLGLSGGLDSTVLLHLLVQMRDSGAIGPFTLMHVHHGLQPHADAWAEHAVHAARECSTEIKVVHVNVSHKTGQGIEAAAREARYNALAGGLEEGGILLTAHHMDDQAETFLIQMMRGAGVRGLSAMAGISPFRQGWHVRPMLGLCRRQLHEYACAHGLKWVDDPSNEDVSLARNHVRHHVIPVLRQHWPQAVQTLDRAASRMAATEGLLGELARLDLEQARTDDARQLDVVSLQRLSDERLKNAIRFWMLELGFNLPPEARLGEIRGLLDARADALPQLQWAGAVLRRWRHRLYAMPPQVVIDARTFRIQWDAHEPLDIPSLGLRLEAHVKTGLGLRLDDVMTHGLSIRLRTGGETIQLHGNSHHTTLKNLFQSKSVLPWERMRMPLFFIDDALVQVGDQWIAAGYHASKHEPGLVIHLCDMFATT